MVMNQAFICCCSLIATALSGAETVDLLGLQSFQPGGALPPAWTAVPARGQRAPTLTLQDSAGHRFLRLAGTRTAGWFVNRLASPVPPSTARLAVSWRVLVAPAGADLRAAASDDAALRVFVVFAMHGPLQRTPRTLFYTTGAGEPVGFNQASFQSRALHVIRIGPNIASSTWLETELDPFADYRRVWGGRLPAIVAVGLMQDTDQTGGTAIADVRMLSWAARPPPVADSPLAWAARPGRLDHRFYEQRGE
jgi:Protein of unknown function (DUF3047)